jgi:Cytosolic carboxypeptidase N-terminal domain/Zinc carboxypeptidase
MPNINFPLNVLSPSLGNILFALMVLIFAGCRENQESPWIDSQFESGSIGNIQKIHDAQFDIFLADDNGDDTLPDSWRNWFYIRINHLNTDDSFVLNLKNRGWPFYYLPVYSYDQVNWHRFSESEVTQPGEYELRMEKKFDRATVWVARFYPYTFSDLISYIGKFSDNPRLTVETPAKTYQGNPIYFLTLTHPGFPDSAKQRVWIHARTHPGETGPSFVLEGLVDFLLSGLPEADNILSQFIFNIIPMHNIDGVIAGNYRTTPQTENLEVMWFSDPYDPMGLTADAPVEVSALHDLIWGLNETGPAFTIALNLHASNSEPDIGLFFFPHFGPENLGYDTAESSLWNKQIRFIDSMGRHYGQALIEPTPDEGGSSFATKTYPESFWWRNFKDEVMAITMETTYGRAGYSPDWITPADLRSLGDAMAFALGDYAVTISFDQKPAKMMLPMQERLLLYPELYGPDAPDELKE